ncbi:MAG: pirin family protein [Azonexus sp.]|nr:pirin family protein [Azonexus sp.]
MAEQSGNKSDTTIARIAPRLADIGGISVSRLLPTRQRRMIGAWCFLDHAGPAEFAAGGGMRVGAHPHTCLQTFTWMIAGEVLHRDSLGNVQTIRPGQVNLMTAGRGVVHTEESPAGETRLHAAQLWIALPPALGDCEPAFEHYPDLPRWTQDGCTLTLLAGAHGGQRSPVRLHSPLLGLELHANASSRLVVPLQPDFEHGILVLDGEARIGGERFVRDELADLGRGREVVELEMAPDSRLLLLGGEPFAAEILMWWNFVGFSKDGIARAQRDWESGSPRFGAVAGHDGPRLVAPPLPWPGY